MNLTSLKSNKFGSSNMNNIRLFSSLRIRLILLVLLAIIPALGIILYDAAELRRREVAKAQANALTLSRLAASRHEELVEATRQTLLSLAQLPEVRNINPAVCSAHLTTLLEEYQGYNVLVVANPEGEIVCSTAPLAQPVNVADRAWFQRALQTGGFAVGDYQRGLFDNNPLLVFGYPLIDTAGQVQGVVAAGHDIGQLNQIAAETDLPDEATLTVIDRNGTVVVHHPPLGNWVGQTLPNEPLIMAIRVAGEGKTEVAGLDKVPRLYAFTSLHNGGETGLYLAVGIPKQIAFAEADRIWTRNLIVLGLAGLLALGAAWLGSDLFVLRNVNKLIDATRQLRSDLSARTNLTHNAGELGQLARTFDNMAAALEEREHDLQQTLEELRVLNTTLEDQVIERTAFLQLLQDVAVAANQATTVNAAMQFALDRICRYTGWPVGHLYLPDENASPELIPTDIWHIDDPARFSAFREVTQTVRRESNVDLPGRALATGEPAWIMDVTKDACCLRARADQAKKVGVKAGFAFPVLIGQEVVAVLEFFSEEEVEPDESLLEAMTHLCIQLGHVVERKRAENQIRESERKLIEAQQIAHVGSWQWDIQTNTISWSDELYRIYGLKPQELHASFEGFLAYIHPDDRDKVRKILETAYQDNQPFTYEYRILRLDGTVRTLQARGLVVPDEDGHPVKMVGTEHDITEQKQMEAELIEMQRRLLEGAEMERLHIAQEVHDGPMQELHGISYRLGELEEVLPDDASLGQLVASQAMLQQVIQDLRALCTELRPPTLAPFGLEKAIRSHAGSFQATHPQLNIQLDLASDGQTLSEQVRLALFRIYQEGLNNVVRHAEASHLQIRFSLDEKQSVLEIEDDGRGFKLPPRPIQLARQGHLGLIGAIERAEAVGGQLKITSAPEKGTLIRIVVPRQ